jgi:hypothetical protein
MLGLSRIVACVALAVTITSGQESANFSGEWVLIDPSIDPIPVLTIVQNEQRIRIEARSSGGPSSGSYGVGTVGGVIGPIFPEEKSPVSSGHGKTARSLLPSRAGD